MKININILSFSPLRLFDTLTHFPHLLGKRGRRKNKAKIGYKDVKWGNEDIGSQIKCDRKNSIFERNPVYFFLL